MNTAARVLVARQYQDNKIQAVTFSKVNAWISLLVFVIFLSAFSIVYLKDLNRRLFIQYQTQQQIRQHEEALGGKLLLQQSTLKVQGRIQAIAQQQLDMVVPKQQDIVLVEE